MGDEKETCTVVQGTLDWRRIAKVGKKEKDYLLRQEEGSKEYTLTKGTCRNA